MSSGGSKVGVLSLKTVRPSKRPLTRVETLECYHCAFKTKVKPALRHHIKKAHLVERPYACDLCGFRAIRPHDLANHKKTHVVFGCSLCNYRSFKKLDVELHLSTHKTNTPEAKNEEIYTCGHCNFQSDLHCDYLTHLTTHSKGSSFECGNCGFKTDDRRSLRRHLANHTGENGWFECSDCDYHTKVESRLQAHVASHTKRKHTRARNTVAEPQYGCDFCDFTTKRKSYLTAHTATHLKEKSFACDKCSYRTLKKSRFERHAIVHTEAPAPLFHCHNCHFRTNYKPGLKNHLRTKHGIEEAEIAQSDNKANDTPNAGHAEEQRYACDICKYKTARERYLKRHMRRRHKQQYKCDICNFTAIGKVYLTAHKIVHAKENQFSSDTSSYGTLGNKDSTPSALECYLCQYKIDCKDNMRQHMQTHISCTERQRETLALLAGDATGPGVFRCDVCQFMTTDESILQKHKISHTMLVLHCNYCDYSTQCKTTLKAHLSVHTERIIPSESSETQGTSEALSATGAEVESFVCDICSFQGTDMGALKRHKRKHSEITFVCKLCSYKTFSQSRLTQHFGKTHGDKKYGCRFCEFKCRNRSNAVVHEKIHSGVKPLTCAICPYSTQRRSDLRRHMNGKHTTAKRRFRCGDCELRFLDQPTLERHRKVHTGEQPFGCAICNKKVQTVNSLRGHVVRAHARQDGELEDGFVCNLCDHHDKGRKNIADHIMSNHTAETYVTEVVVTGDALVN